MNFSIDNNLSSKELLLPEKIIPSHYRDIILVYCIPKVGSTSLISSIRLSASDKFAVFHTHTDTVLKSLEPQNNNVFYSDIVQNGYFFNENTQKHRKIYVIDIYRPSIERKISDFFQELCSLHFFNNEENIVNYPIDKIIKRFNDIYPYLEDSDYYNEKYNIENHLTQFDFDKKYMLYEKNNIFYIKLRLKDSHLWGNILSNILETKIEYIIDYETKNKDIGNLYEIFKKEYKLPLNFFQKMEQCKYLKYYYNDAERFEYLSNWYNKLTTIYIPFTLEQYNFYEKISLENKFRESDTKLHYRDNGCLCINCSNHRMKILNDIDNNEYIIHDTNEKLNTHLIVQLFFTENNILYVQNMLLNV